MANLLSLAEMVHNQIFPMPRDKSAISLEEFIETAKMEYAASMWYFRLEMIALEGFFMVPSDLLTEVELPVENNEIDISSLKNLFSLPGDLWLQNVGGIDCECKYVKTTLNLSQLLCDDESMGDDVHLYYIVGKKIKFLKNPPTKQVPITYANTGIDINVRTIEVNDYVASKVREKLFNMYAKRMPIDDTNNNNPDK